MSPVPKLRLCAAVSIDDSEDIGCCEKETGTVDGCTDVGDGAMGRVLKGSIVVAVVTIVPLLL